MALTNNNRRRFLGFLTTVVLAVIGLLVAIPALGFFLAPLRRRLTEEGAGAVFVNVGPLAALPAGKWHLLSLEISHMDGWKRSRVTHSIWVRRDGEGHDEITVLSPICPHLGCPINWHPDQSEFMCPCHGGTFDSDGRHISGPPPRSMDPLPFEVRAGQLWVRWENFKIGVAERVPVNV